MAAARREADRRDGESLETTVGRLDERVGGLIDSFEGMRQDFRDLKQVLGTLADLAAQVATLQRRVDDLEKDKDADRERVQFYFRAVATALIPLLISAGYVLVEFIGSHR